MAQRRPVLVLLLLCVALVATLALLPALSRDPNGGAHAASRVSAAVPYGRLVIAQDGISTRIKSHQLGVTNPTGRAEFGPLTVVKNLDASSITLFEDAATGVHLEEVVVTVFKPNGTDAKATYTLEDALVTDIQHGETTESVSFVYQKITVEAGGNSFCFDVLQNRVCQ
jgi:hypothetical protein